jgi:hypothetical protein
VSEEGRRDVGDVKDEASEEDKMRKNRGNATRERVQMRWEVGG